jgi:hypothetical protein
MPVDYTKMSRLERYRLTEKIFIEYPRLKKLMNRIEHCLWYSKIAAEPECMFIGGPTGAGKTTLQDHYLEKYPRVIQDEGAIVPILCARVPNKATDKNLVTELLIEIGDPIAEKGSAYNQTTRLRTLIKNCEVQLIILDEFQHFVDKDSQKVLKTVSDWLKNLIDQTKKPIILIGMPYAVQILDAVGNEQLQRRFATRESLHPFGWGTIDEIDDFRAFLKAVDNQLPLMERSQLADPMTALRFYCATNGVVGNVMKLIRRATEFALEESLERLTLHILAQAYDDRLRADRPNKKNPFCCDKTELKVVQSSPNIQSTGRRLKPKRREERASEVLKKR